MHFPAEKTVMDLHFHIGIDFEHALFHNFCFIFPNRLSCCDNLTVQICQTYFIIVNQIECAYACPNQCFTDVSSHAADSKHCHTGIFQPSIASFPSSNSVLENCVNIYELLLSHFSYRNTLYYVRFQTASLSSYLCQAIAKCSPAHAAAYTVGRAIIQNYEFIGIHFCLFR